jgi:hypothetical protein
MAGLLPSDKKTAKWQKAKAELRAINKDEAWEASRAVDRQTARRLSNRGRLLARFGE